MREDSAVRTARGVVPAWGEAEESVTTRNRYAVSNVNSVDAPPLTGATVIAGHAPAQPGGSETERQVDDRSGKALRIATPCLTACNRTAPITADCTVITTDDKAAAKRKNVLKCISTVSAHLQHASVEPNIWVHVRRFEIKILLEDQLN